MSAATVFKKCPQCSTVWESQDDFISDPQLRINGYLAHMDDLELSRFYFTHTKEDCHSTLVIQAKHFLNLYSGKRYPERRTGSEECPGYCLDRNELSRCDAMCECAFNREIIQIILERQNNSSEKAAD